VLFSISTFAGMSEKGVCLCPGCCPCLLAVVGRGCGGVRRAIELRTEQAKPRPNCDDRGPADRRSGAWV
jgi:hypothetical protein